MNAVIREEVVAYGLRSLPLLAKQEDALLRFLAARGELVDIEKGDLICSKGDSVVGIFCILKGSIKVAVISTQGNERVLRILGPGGLLGEAFVFLDSACPVYAEALMPVRALFIKKTCLVDAIHRFPRFAFAMLQAVSEGQLRLVRDVEVCCLQPAGERVAGFLLEHAEPLASGQEAEVRLPAGKAVVASSLNLTPETFSRELHQLATKGLIKVEKRTIRLQDLRELHSLVGGDAA